MLEQGLTYEVSLEKDTMPGGSKCVEDILSDSLYPRGDDMDLRRAGLKNSRCAFGFDRDKYFLLRRGVIVFIFFP